MASADENLRQQFQLLQEQQQKKLLRRKQRKDEQQRAHTASVVSTTSSNVAFGVADQLDLKLAEPAGKSYLSEELVDHLNDQIRELKDENGRVYKLLSERDFELRNLKKKREEEKTALAATGGPVTNETAGTKIVELSKKIREMTAELESEKTKSRQMTKKCYDLQQQVNKASGDNKSIRASTISLRSSMDEKDDPSEIKVLQDKLKQMESKIVDYRNNNSSLKQELRLTQKALGQEVGENVSIQACLNTNSNWRGRAQQISMLQQKNEDLKQELQKAMKFTKTGGTDADVIDTSTGRKRTAIDRHKEQLKKIENEKKAAQEKMAAEKETLEEDNFALKHKLEASKTRIQVLSSEIKGLKKQLPQLLKKNEHDDELIEALMKEQNKLRLQLDEAQKNQHNIKVEQQTRLNDIAAKQQQDGNVVEQLKTIVMDKETKVKVLENEIQQLKLAHMQRAQANRLFQQNGPGQQDTFPHPPQQAFMDSRPSTGFETVDLQYTVDCESRLSEHPSSAILPGTQPTPTPTGGVPAGEVTKPPSRGPSRARSRNRPSSANRPQSTGGVADRQLLNELQYQCQEYRTVAQVAEVEREKVTELMKVLHSRLDEANIKVQDYQRELVEQRRKNAMLEKQIGKANLNTARSSAGNTSARRKQTGKSALTASVTSMPVMVEDEEISNMSMEELTTNLEIQRDENAALKAALQSTLKAKEEDLTMYSDTIEETKKVFLQALRQYKQTVQGTT